MSGFDPRGILAALERHRVAYVVIGDLAGVLHGSDLSARGLEITPSLKPGNLERLERALEDLDAPPRARARVQQLDPEHAAVSVRTPRGELVLTPAPAGTRGYEDLRRAATREPLGQGIRAPIASAPDLIRILAAQGREQDLVLERRLRRVVELEQTLALEF